MVALVAQCSVAPHLESSSIIELSHHVQEQRSPLALVLNEREWIGLECQEIERVKSTVHFTNVFVTCTTKMLGDALKNGCQFLSFNHCQCFES
jgi:hypothetical protein